MEVYEYVGAIHVHTRYSDGTNSLEEIISMAQDLGLDFIMFSDHNTLKPYQEGKQGWYGELLVIIGCEIEDIGNMNHYLAFGIDTIPNTKDPLEYVAAVRDAGGLGIIAHPDESRSFRPIHTPLPWTRWDVDGFDAIEVWNYMSQWIVGMRPWNMIFRIISPDRAVSCGPSREALEIWDRINMKRPVTGIGSLDVHGIRVGFWGRGIDIIPHKAILGSILTHILLHDPFSGEAAKDIEVVLNALRNRRAFFANHRHGDARGLRFWAIWGDETALMGDEVDWRPGMKLVLSSPLPSHLVIFRNGLPFVEGEVEGPGSLFEIEAQEPGNYRAALIRNGRGWAYTNNIYLRGEDT